MPFVGIRKVRRASEQPRQGLDRPVWSMSNVPRSHGLWTHLELGGVLEGKDSIGHLQQFT